MVLALDDSNRIAKDLNFKALIREVGGGFRIGNMCTAVADSY